MNKNDLLPPVNVNNDTARRFPGRINRTGKHISAFYNRFFLFYPIVDRFFKPGKVKLMEEVNHLPAGQLLGIGVGNGTHLQGYKKHQVTAIDISASMLRLAQTHKPNNAVLLQMDGENMSFADNQFNIIVLSHVLAVAVDPDRLIQEVRRVLKPGGQLFILNHFTPDGPLKYIDRLFSPVSSLFHFRSVFNFRDVEALETFLLIKIVPIPDRWSYFKLLVFKK